MDPNDTEPTPPRSLLDQIRSDDPAEQQTALGFIMGAWVEHVDGDYCPILGCPVCADKAAGITPIGGWTDFRMRVTGISEGKLTIERVPTSWKIPEVPATEWMMGLGAIHQAFPSGWGRGGTGPRCEAIDPNGSRCALPRGHELDDFDVTTCPKEHEYHLDVERVLRPELLTVQPGDLIVVVQEDGRRTRTQVTRTIAFEDEIVIRIDQRLPPARLVGLSRELHATPSGLTSAMVASAARKLTSIWLCTGPGPERLAVVHLVDVVVSKFYELPGNNVGGQLHTVLDDTNIETASVRYAAKCAHEAGDDCAYAVAGLLLAMTFEERQKLASNCDCGCLPTVDEV